MELSVWKQAHSVALEVSEREAKAHNVQVAALNRQISNLDCFRGVWPLLRRAATSDPLPDPKPAYSLHHQWR